MTAKKPKNIKEYITERINIEKFIPGGQALGTLESGKKIFLWNALPGEIVTKVQLTKSKNSYAEGIAIEIEKPASERITPRDECFLSTSPWQIITYDYELQQKHELLEEIFRQHKIGLPTGVNIAPVQTDGKDFFYRNKMEYALYYSHEDQQIYPAFRARGSHQKLIVRGSSLERPEIFAAAQNIIRELNDKHEEARKYQSLLLRTNQAGEVSGGLIENHQPRPKFQLLSDAILGRSYSYSPNGFFQINLPVYEMTLREIQKHITTEKVLDLYSGVGTIGLSVARNQDLTLVECDKSAYLEMERNCQGTSARPILAKSEEALEYIAPDQTVIVDPPRAGCRPELLDKFLETQPETIIYLSCNPATQARDLKILTDGRAYEITKVVPFNFFPRTPHLENLVVLQRKTNQPQANRHRTSQPKPEPQPSLQQPEQNQPKPEDTHAA